jgi:hypothetical protein
MLAIIDNIMAVRTDFPSRLGPLPRRPMVVMQGVDDGCSNGFILGSTFPSINVDLIVKDI